MAVVDRSAAQRLVDRVSSPGFLIGAERQAAGSAGSYEHRDPTTGRVQADRAVAEKIPVLDRLMTPEFRAKRPDMAFLFRQMGTFNTAKMADLRNLNADGPSAQAVADSGIPICFLAGEVDAVLGADTVRAAAKRVAGSVLELVPGAPHSMYWEAPELFTTDLSLFE